MNKRGGGNDQKVIDWMERDPVWGLRNISGYSYSKITSSAKNMGLPTSRDRVWHSDPIERGWELRSWRDGRLWKGGVGRDGDGRGAEGPGGRRKNGEGVSSKIAVSVEIICWFVAAGLCWSRATPATQIT
jgi:hypothetical protein